MKKLIKIITVISLIFCPALSFAQMTNEEIIREYTPELQIEYVLNIAKEHAKKEKIKLKEYYIKSIEYDPDKKEWTVHFQGRILAPGVHFTIFIEDRTKKTILMPGQ